MRYGELCVMGNGMNEGQASKSSCLDRYETLYTQERQK
jgi:hypothetical protein